MTRYMFIGIFIVLSLFMFFSISCDKDSPTSPSDEVTITKVSGDGQASAPGDTLAVPLTVLLKDRNGDVLSGKRVDFKTLSGTASFSDSIVTTNISGKASTIIIIGDIVEDIRVEAKVFGINKYVIFNITSTWDYFSKDKNVIICGTIGAVFSFLLSPANGTNPTPGSSCGRTSSNIRRGWLFP